MIDNNDNFVHPAGREVASDVGVKAKSPVSLLQEVYVRRGMTPQYDLVQVEGEVHQPTFKYRVTVGRTLATGCGHSKKKAKHCAAKIMLDKLKHLEQPADSSCSQLPIPELSSEVLSPYEDCVEGNPVGSLQELCGARRWPPPVYLLTQGEEGAVVFTLDCVIKTFQGTFTETGAGNSKKMAKRQAANQMIQRLRDLPPEKEDASENENEDDPALYNPHKTGEGKPSKQMSKFHKNLKTSKGPLLSQLLSIELKSVEDCVTMLREISKEQGFLVTYVDLEDVSKSARRQSMVQLTTEPVSVCYGQADTAAAAKQEAARDALDYLQLMRR